MNLKTSTKLNTINISPKWPACLDTEEDIQAKPLNSVIFETENTKNTWADPLYASFNFPSFALVVAHSPYVLDIYIFSKLEDQITKNQDLSKA